MVASRRGYKVENKYMELLAAIINKYIEDNNLTIRDFAKKSGLALSHIDNLRKNKAKGLTLRTLLSLAEAMDITLLDILLQCELIKSEQIGEKKEGHRV